jgi:GAF domain-containing protein
MKRRKTGTARPKGIRRKTAIKNVRLARPSLKAEISELSGLQRELAEARERLSASSDILRAIAAAPADAEGSLRKIAETCARLFGAVGVSFRIAEGDAFKLSVGVGQGAEQIGTDLYADPAKRPTVGGRNLPGAVVRGNRQIHLPDLDDLNGEQADWPGVLIARKNGIRTMVGTPLRSADRAIGALMVYRNVLQPFEPAELQLLQSFADQAVIAIENGRLLTELRERTADLQESLARQTATSEILRVISQSPTDVQPVFESIVVTAARLLRCDLVFVLLCDGATFWNAAVASPEGPLLADRPLRSAPIDPDANFPARAILDKKMLLLPDWSLIDLPEHERMIHEKFGVNSALYLPLLREGECIGLLTFIGKRPNIFGPGEIAQAESFRDQAVIAIENTRLFNQTKEALEQQTATSEVLQVISSTPGDLQPVFAKMLENAVRICGATFGTIYRADSDGLQVVATHNMPSALAEQRHSPQYRPGAPDTPLGDVLATKTVVHVANMAEHKAYSERRVPALVSGVEIGGVRAWLGVPMLRESELIGAIVLHRQEARPFSDKQIALVTNFASQAVIAIENARLLNELRESLEQQTATSEVLGVISKSPGDLQPVFQTMLDNATRLCGAPFGTMLLRDGGVLRLVARVVPPGTAVPLFEIGSELVIAEHANHPLVHMLSTPEITHIPDMRDTPAYHQRNPRVVAFVENIGARSVLRVPLVKDGECIGGFVVFRQELSLFSDKQTALMQNFAAQAVIAIENARLLSELRESLEQQTATTEVLQVISSSPGAVQPVFAKILESAARLCEVSFGVMSLREGDVFRVVGMHNAPPAYVELRRREPTWKLTGPLGRVADQAVATGRAVQIADLADGIYQDDATSRDFHRTTNARSFIIVPLLKDDTALGLMAVYRQEVRPFSDKHVELLTNFAAQAVIAIENTRLLTELRARTDELGRSVGELRALGEVSQAVNSTLDLENVLETIVAKAVQLSDTEAGAIYVFDDISREFHLRATYGMDRELIAALSKQHIGLDESSIALVMTEREPVQVADLRGERPNPINDIVLRAGFRARLTAPLLRGDQIVGMLVVRRRTPGAFAQNTVDLIKTFAAQSGWRSRTRGSMPTWRRVPASWRPRSRSCAPRRTGWCRPRSLLRSGSSPPVSPMRSKIRSISSTTSPRFPPNCWTSSRTRLRPFPLTTRRGPTLPSWRTCCAATSKRWCSTASAPTRSSRTCCCIRARARANVS